jgi:hypothetical protein
VAFVAVREVGRQLFIVKSTVFAFAQNADFNGGEVGVPEFGDVILEQVGVAVGAPATVHADWSGVAPQTQQGAEIDLRDAAGAYTALFGAVPLYRVSDAWGLAGGPMQMRRQLWRGISESLNARITRLDANAVPTATVQLFAWVRRYRDLPAHERVALERSLL